MVSRILRIILVAACMHGNSLLGADPKPASELPPEYVDAVRSAVRAFGNRDFEKTIEALNAAEAIVPPSPLTLNTRGAVLIEQKKFAEGQALCEKALAIDPKFYPARFNLAEIPLMQGRYPEAREMFQKILDEHPKDELVMFRIMLIHLREKNDAEARRMLELIPFPGQTAAYYYANAAWEFAHGNPEEGDKWVKRANWVFKPQMTVNFSDALKEVGWLNERPGATAVLPDLVPRSIGSAKLELEAPAPAAPLIPTPEKPPEQ